MGKVMKVLWFTSTASLAAKAVNSSVVGGGWIESLERYLRKRANIDLAVAFIHGKERMNKFTEQGTTYYAIADTRSRARVFVKRHLASCDDAQLIDSYLDVIEDFKPDIINVFGTEKNFGLISERTKVPVVIHLQGILTMLEKKWFVPGIGKKTLLACSSIKSLLRATSPLHEYYAYKSAAVREQRMFLMNRYFMGRTDWDKRVTDLLSPGSEYFTGNEILRREFYVAKWNKKAQESKTFISTIQPNIFKGLDTILECASILKKADRFPFKWIIAGIPEDHYVVRLFERKAGLRFKDVNVLLKGKMKADELLKAEMDADVFIHPSHIDNSPNSVCEAMLTGMPVIATCTGGTGSLLDDRKEGLLIPGGDAYSMAGALLELTSQPLFAAQLGQQARERAIRRHDPEEITDNLIAIYSELLKKQTSRQPALLTTI
jgi:glycosyltransferase involved in cell wall biosynthesis